MHWWESGHAVRTHYRYIGLRVLKQGPEILTKNSRTCIEIHKIISVVHLLVSFSVRPLTQIMTTGRGHGLMQDLSVSLVLSPTPENSPVLMGPLAF